MTDIVTPAPERLPDWAVGAVNLASPRLGSKALACSDDSFAPMARMCTHHSFAGSFGARSGGIRSRSS